MVITWLDFHTVIIVNLVHAECKPFGFVVYVCMPIEVLVFFLLFFFRVSDPMELILAALNVYEKWKQAVHILTLDSDIIVRSVTM